MCLLIENMALEKRTFLNLLTDQGKVSYACAGMSSLMCAWSEDPPLVLKPIYRKNPKISDTENLLYSP